MHKDNNYSILGLIGLIIVFFCLQRYFYVVNLALHGLIDIFAAGRSLVKVELFFGYTVLLCFAAIFSNAKKIPDYIFVSVKWLWICIIATFLYSLFTLWHFLNSWGFNLRDFVVVFHNNEISSTMLLHNHNMKGINATFLNFFGAAYQENADTGLAFLGLMSPIWFWIGASLVLVSAILLIFKFVEIYQSQSKWRPLFILLYSMLSFSILKNMLDGGILNHETPIALSALVLLITIHYNNSRSKEVSMISYLWSLIPIGIYCVTVFVLWQMKYVSPVYFMSNLYSMIAFVVCVMALIYWQQIAQKRTILGLCLLIITAGVGYLSISYNFGTYLNSRRLINESGAIVGLFNEPDYGRGSASEWQLVETINNLKIYRVTSSEPTSIHELLQNNHLLNNLLPIQLPGITCIQDSKSSELSFDIISQKPIALSNVTHRFGRVVSLNQLKKSQAMYKYRVSMYIDPCAPRILNVVQSIFQEEGLETFFLTNISNLYDPGE